MSGPSEPSTCASLGHADSKDEGDERLHPSSIGLERCSELCLEGAGIPGQSASAAPPPIPKTTPLAPKDHGEAVAIFRSEIVGALTRKELDNGELRAAFRALSEERFRPPGVETTRRNSVATLERWYYAYRAGGLAALRPAPRSDRGHAQELFAEQRQLLLDIRKEHRSASVPLILRTLVASPRCSGGKSTPTVVPRYGSVVAV
jgi:hypothetical protein